jgi:HSP20 family protein
MSLVKNKNGEGGLHPMVNDFFDDNFFKLFFSEFGAGLSGKNFGGKLPSVNISETDKEFKIEVAAPGFDKKEFKIEAEGGNLVISAEKKHEMNNDNENYHRKEFSYHRFTRTFQLPENSRAEDIDAKYENGILKLILPKKEIALTKPKKEIKIS